MHLEHLKETLRKLCTEVENLAIENMVYFDAILETNALIECRLLPESRLMGGFSGTIPMYALTGLFLCVDFLFQRHQSGQNRSKCWRFPVEHIAHGAVVPFERGELTIWRTQPE